MSEHDMCYVAIRPGCGCMCGASVDDGDTKETAKVLADWVKRGFTVERRTVVEVRTGWNPCTREKGCFK